MAGKYGLTGTLALAANTANQYLWGAVSGAADADATLTWLDVTFDGAASAAGIKVELFRATSVPPSATTYTALRQAADSQTASGLSAFYVAPITVGTPGGLVACKTWYVNPAGGLSLQYPLGREDYMPAGTTYWTGMRVSTPSGVSPNCAFNADWCE